MTTSATSSSVWSRVGAHRDLTGCCGNSSDGVPREATRVPSQNGSPLQRGKIHARAPLTYVCHSETCASDGLSEQSEDSIERGVRWVGRGGQLHH